MPEPSRCEWAGTEPLMVAYHDDEWGVSTHDDALLFELLTLEGAQAGLSWRTILNKRQGYRAAFAGFVDAGWDGHLTLELSNVANLPIALYPGMKIGQISFIRMTTPADVPYGSAEVGSKYQGQRGPRPSRYWENFRTD